MNLLWVPLITTLAFLTSCNSSENAMPSFLEGKWTVDPQRSKQASMASADSKSIEWDKFADAIIGKSIQFEKGHMSCNQINSGNPIGITTKTATSFIYIFEQDNSGGAIAIKRISDNLIRVDWSVNIVEVYKKSE